jgi:hypothetical protein
LSTLKLLTVLSIFAFPLAFSADCKPAPKCTPPKKAPANPCAVENGCNPTDWSLQLRGAAFIPLKQQLRDIYGSGLPTIELEGSWSFLKDAWLSCDQLTLWGNVGWTFKTGETIGSEYYTRLNLIPISIGLEYQINLGKGFDFYFGAGPTYSFLRIENYDFVDRHHIKKNQFGFTTKTGLRYTFFTNYFIDIFADYYYTEFGKMHDSIQSIDNHFSGFIIGGGFGGKW